MESRGGEGSAWGYGGLCYYACITSVMHIYTRCFVLCMLMTRLSLHHSCASTGKAIPKDKAIKRFVVRYVLSTPCLRMQFVSMYTHHVATL
jgi:hypothetical protein